MGDLEHDLRQALAARAATVVVGRADEPSLGRRLAQARRRRRNRLGGAALAIVVVAGALAAVTRSGEARPNVVAGPGPSTTIVAEPTTAREPVTASSSVPAPILPPAPPTTGTAPTLPRTTATTVPRPALPPEVIWPAPGTTATFTTPAQAATDFARRFLGMGSPTLATPQVRGSDATVELRLGPRGGQPSVVTLRRITGRGWVVTGCAAPSIQVDQPAPGATIGSPLVVRGRAQAFEGHVDVEVRRDGPGPPIGQSFGTGGGTEILPFEATVTFARPAPARGTVVVSEPRADVADQGPAAATVVRVAF